MSRLRYERFLFVRDDFYDAPDRIARLAKGLKYYEPGDYTGYLSTEVYSPTYIKRRLERILGARITRWDTDPDDGNGQFYLGLSAGPHKEIPGVHYDEPEDDLTVVVYLTPGLVLNCGTSLWKHKSTQLTGAPTIQDSHRLKKPIGKIRDMLERHSNDPSKWIEIDRVGYRYNHLVAYPSGVLHSATRHYGRSATDGRLYQTFRLGVDWRRLAFGR